MSNESKEHLQALRIILLVLDEIVKNGGRPRYDGDESSVNSESFKKLVMQFAGDRVSESSIDEALKIPLKKMAEKLIDESRR